MSQVSPSDLQNNEAVDPRFIEFVMGHAQQATLFLGQFPHPTTGEVMFNLKAAKLFIDQLDMIKGKTKGNLTPQEEDFVTKIVADLQLLYVQVARKQEAEGEGASASDSQTEELSEKSIVDGSEKSVEAPNLANSADTGESEGKKKFSKSYGI